jgi:toxin ParE1/3/4
VTKVVLRPQAEDDLAAIHDFIADQAGARIAERYLHRLEVAIFALSDFPSRGTLRPDIGRGVRTTGFERRVTLLFRVLESEVEILRVLYGGRNFEAILGGEADGV